DEPGRRRQGHLEPAPHRRRRAREPVVVAEARAVRRQPHRRWLGRRLPQRQRPLPAVLDDPLLRHPDDPERCPGRVGDHDAMTTRDRLVIVVVLLVAALAGFWFLALGPKRKEAADLDAQIATQTQQLTTA